jgi:hypothetical protein
LRFLQRFFGPFALVLGALLFAQIEHESDTFVPASFEERAADQHGHAAAVFPKVLLLERSEGPSRLYLCDGPFVPVTPFRRRQVRPNAFITVRRSSCSTDVPIVVVGRTTACSSIAG